MKRSVAIGSIALFIFLLWANESHSAAVLESGINPSNPTIGIIDKIKAGKDFRYAVMFVKDQKSIEVESTGPRSATYDDYLKNFKVAKQCRYGLFDYELACAQTGKNRNKLVLMSWCPDAAQVRTKFVHASSVEGVKRAVPGATFVQASDDDEASLKSVEAKIRSSVTAC